MTKIIMHGCNGVMGQMICNLIAADEEVEVVDSYFKVYF